MIRGRIVGQEYPSDIVIEKGIVVSVGRMRGRAPDLGSADTRIGPTLFDIQVNGLCGIDLQSPDLTPEAVRAMTDALVSWGVSRWIPTLITAPLEQMERQCRTIVEAMQDPRVARAIPGIHLEGPYISPQDGPRGAHAREYVRAPSLREFARLHRAAQGRIRCITLAPESEGAIRFIKAVARRGVVVALGHHNATAAQIAAAVDAGARLSTHLGNGLASTIHRHLNPIWPQLADDRLAASLIADLDHLPAPVLKSFVRAKGAGRVILTSDCVHVAGLKPGRYALGTLAVELLPSGRICLTGTDLLAGSSLMLLQGVVNAARVTDLSLEEAFACASAVPARFFGIRPRPFPPRPGSRVDFVVFDLEPGKGKQPQARVRAVFVDGLLAR